MENNNFYTVEDFEETLKRTPFRKEDVKEVLASWGNTNGVSKERGGSDLVFGVLIWLKSRHVVYIRGWNDYTGWGCQDGVYFFSAHVWYTQGSTSVVEALERDILNIFPEKDFSSIIWDNEPADLSLWLKTERGGNE